MSSPAPQSAAVFVARQPILDRSKKLFGYELLFRAAETETSASSSERATARVITDAVLGFGLEALTPGSRAFINITRDVLLSGVPSVLSPRHVVLELLEDIDADPEVVAACGDLKRAGYSIALDDFVLTERNEGLLPFADFVKVEFGPQATEDNRRRVVERCRSERAALLAERIETLEQFDQAVAEGFRYFQGFFFGRPETLATREIGSYAPGYFRILSALHDPDLTVLQLEALVKHDAALCYRVLRVVNSASFAQRSQVESIRQALVLLGLDTLRRWASVWILAGLGQHQNTELVVMSIVRARCCELIGQTTNLPGGFLLGMCSLLPVMLGCSMETVVEGLPLPAQTRDALLGHENTSRHVLDCVVAYERGDWDRCLHLADMIGLDRAELPAAHKDALIWAADFKKAL